MRPLFSAFRFRTSTTTTTTTALRSIDLFEDSLKSTIFGGASRPRPHVPAVHAGPGRRQPNRIVMISKHVGAGGHAQMTWEWCKGKNYSTSQRGDTPCVMTISHGQK